MTFHAKRQMTRFIGCSTVLVSWLALTATAEQPPDMTRGLTAIDGLKVGHHQLRHRPTGCTVVLAERGAVGAVDVRGAAPGTRETDLLDPINSVQQVHAIVLSGGSAFGLATADGVMRYLEERDIGFDTGVARVPIVPAAILYDLSVGEDPRIRPSADCGYKASQAATTNAVAEGNVGAGTGATVGKLGGASRAMKGGIGTAAVDLGSGVRLAALMAVNAVGDIIDPETGAIVAGVRTSDGRALADARTLLRTPEIASTAPKGHNTTIGVVATNVVLSKAQLAIIARMAHDGLARAVRPAHTPSDGDTIFALSTGTHSSEVSLLRLGAFAADVTAEAIVRGVRAATGIPGYPAARNLKGSTR